MSNLRLGNFVRDEFFRNKTCADFPTGGWAGFGSQRCQGCGNLAETSPQPLRTSFGEPGLNVHVCGTDCRNRSTKQGQRTLVGSVSSQHDLDQTTSYSHCRHITVPAPQIMHFFNGQDVWVIAGNHSDRHSAEHAAKVVGSNDQRSNRTSVFSSNDEIMIEWHFTRSVEVVNINRVRPMHDDDGPYRTKDTSCANSVSEPSQPTRKSRRASKKPDRYDNCFANSQYQSMTVDALRCARNAKTWTSKPRAVPRATWSL